MKLGEYLVNLLLEENSKTIAIFPGAFKPPHKGHYDVVKQLSTLADEVIVLISSNSRDGVSAEESFAVWQLYAPFLDSNVSFKIAATSPVSEAYDVIKNNPDQKFIVAFGKGESDRFNQIKTSGKYNNASIYDAGNAEEGISATYLRNALRWKNSEEIKKYIPKDVDVEEFKNVLSITNKEEKLQESPPLEFEQDDYQDYILQQRDKIEKAAAYFNLPIPDMEYAFNAGRPVVLNDSDWAKLENANSFNIMDLEHAIRYAHGKGIKVKPYIDAIRNGEELPLPLVLNYSQDKYYLVAGDVVLSLYRALKQIPTVLQATLNLSLNESKIQKKSQIAEFVKFAINELSLKTVPTIKFSYNTNEAQNISSFGYFDPAQNHIWVYIKNRNTADILRTLAHELVHRKQDEENRIEQGSGETGSEIENEANAQAGVLLRKFGKENKGIYESVMIEKKNQYKIYCDMDGVIVDFEDGYERLTGKNIKGNHVKGDSDFWQPISDAGANFWINLKWMPDGKELWSYLKPYNPEILSAPSREKSSRVGKEIWVRNNIPGTELILKPAPEKQELAEPNAILIDDRKDNIQQWKDAGGIGILHTSANNTIKQLQELGL
jgi:cytidyltransferase-like protein